MAKSNKKTGNNGARGKRGPGRPKGSPNKATADAREAFKRLVEGNMGKFQRWLQTVAEGVKVFDPELDDEGNPALDDKGKPKGTWNYLVRPDPGHALKLCADLAEFIIPKLARTEHVGDNGGAIKVEAEIEFVTPGQRPTT